jgi:hypothetical protein
MKFLITIIVGFVIYKFMSSTSKIDTTQQDSLDQEPDEDYVDYEEVE